VIAALVAATACTAFSTDVAPPSDVADAASDALPTADGAVVEGGNEGGNVEGGGGDGGGGEAGTDAGCPALPTAATSLLCAGAPCAAPASLCCSDAVSPAEMVCTEGGSGCAAFAAHRTRRCGSRFHCLAGQSHCCASAFVLTSANQCPLLAKGADIEGWGSSCEPMPCSPSYELCAAGDVCPGGTHCMPVSVVTDGQPTIVGICRPL
jgi:hypothetical protein